MEIGIGLPATIPGVSGQQILDWALRADQGPFSSLGIIDRLVYPNYEPMVTLAAAAAVTSRIRLMTTVLLAPLRHGGELAKQAASLDNLSTGRLTLGLGVGGRPDDYEADPASFHDRGQRFDQQLELMHRAWAGESVEGAGKIGPPPVQPGGPPILIGGYVPAAIHRLGRWGVGFISGGADPATAQQLYQVAEQAWRAGGRSGKPRFVAGAYWALGPDAAERGGAYIRNYYGFLGDMVNAMAQGLPSTPDAVAGAIRAYADVGVDELVLWPCIPDVEQVDRLADLVK